MSPFAANYAPLDADTINTLKDMYAWTPVKRFDDNRASSDGPTLTTTYWQSFQDSGTRVYIAWKGMEGDSRIFISFSDDEGLSWTSQIPLDGIRSSYGPGLTGYYAGPGSTSLDDVFLAWKGEGADERLFYATGFNGNAFTSINRLEGHSSTARPSVAVYQRRVYMAWKAASGEFILISSWVDGRWKGVEVVPNAFTSHAPALAAFATSWSFAGREWGTMCGCSRAGLTERPQLGHPILPFPSSMQPPMQEAPST